MQYIAADASDDIAQASAQIGRKHCQTSKLDKHLLTHSEALLRLPSISLLLL